MRLERLTRRAERSIDRDAGFTLVELLIVIVIESLIVGGLGSAFILITNNTGTVKESLARTNDARLAGSYIVSDARNSSGPELSLSDTTSCPDANPPVAGTASAVVRFNWNSTDSTGATKANIVNYVLVSNALLRRQCQSGTLVSDDALATSVAGVAISCSPNSNCSGTPTSITATITETAGANGGAGYQYTVTGAFRKAFETGAAALSSPWPFIALGGGGCTPGATGINISGTGHMRVYGTTYVNSADGSTCKSMRLATSGTYQAGGTKILSGGSCTASGSAVCPTTSPFSPALSDPFSSITAPSTGALTSRSGCPGGAAQPGVYASTLTISSTCTMASGIYVLQGGLSVTNSGILTNAPAGVLIYITGGSFSVSGAGSVSLSTITTGPYAGLVLWQAAADTSSIAFSNGGQLSFAGVFYAPTAELDISGAAVSPTATALVVQSIVLSNSGALTVGSASSTPLSVSSPATLPAWTVNRPYPPTTIIGAGGDGNYIWSATGLPAGLTINSSTGVISGTPTAAGAPTATITLNDALGDDAATKQYTVTINAAPSITTTSPLAAGTQSSAYSTTLVGSGGTTAYSWSATGLPAGLTLAAGTGVISGTPTTAGTSTVAVTLTDAAGATATANLSLTINPSGSGPTITSVTLVNGGSTPGQIQKGDSIVVVFSAQMSVSSFCTGWSNNAANQQLNSNGDVTVTVTDGTGATNDSLSVSAGSCTFHFGTINLGSNAYVSSGDSTFSGPGANKSSIAWNASTFTLTITLGSRSGGSVSTVGSTTPIYAANGSITDSSGRSVSNSPFTLPNGIQF